MIGGVHAAAAGFWQWLMESKDSRNDLRQWLGETEKPLREFRQRLKDGGND